MVFSKFPNPLLGRGNAAPVGVVRRVPSLWGEGAVGSLSLWGEGAARSSLSVGRRVHAGSLSLWEGLSESCTFESSGPNGKPKMA